jgi:hypothetical protein
MALSMEAGRALWRTCEQGPAPLLPAEARVLRAALRTVASWQAFLALEAATPHARGPLSASVVVACRVRRLLLERALTPAVALPAPPSPGAWPDTDGGAEAAEAQAVVDAAWLARAVAEAAAAAHAPPIVSDDYYYTLEYDAEEWEILAAASISAVSAAPAPAAAMVVAAAAAERVPSAPPAEPHTGLSSSSSPSPVAVVAAVPAPVPSTTPAPVAATPAASRGATPGPTPPATPYRTGAGALLAFAHPPALPPPPVLPDVPLGSTGLKYLWSAALGAAGGTVGGAEELRALLSDVKPTHSKWYSEARPNQEELYLACENVHTDARVGVTKVGARALTGRALARC